MMRKTISDGKSQSMFSRSAGVHPKNMDARPMRGGIRL